MPQTPDTKESRPAAPKTFDQALEKLPQKDRANIQKHLDQMAAMPKAATDTWKSLFLALTLRAGHACQAVGTDAVRFFIQDGTYKLQMFALEDKLTEPRQVYLPNVLSESIKAKLLTRGTPPGTYGVVGAADETVKIDELDANTQADAPVHYKFMVGLNRKAIRITLPSRERPALVKLIGAMCDLAIGANNAAEARNKEAMSKQAKK